MTQNDDIRDERTAGALNLDIGTLESYLKSCISHTTESALAYMPVTICSVCETEIKNSVIRRMGEFNDTCSKGYVRESVKRWSIRIASLKHVLKSFDVSCRSAFKTKVGPETAKTYERLIDARNRAAHESPSSIPPDELVDFCRAALDVAHAFGDALNEKPGPADNLTVKE